MSALLASPASAQSLAYDGFDYPVTGAFVVLDGASGGSAVGWDMGPEVLGADCATFTGGHSGAGWVTSSQNRSHTVQNRVVATGLDYPGLATSPGMAVLVNGSALGWNPSGGIRSFRTIDTSGAAAASVRTASGMIGAGEVWIAFLGALDSRTSMSTNGYNGGMHLFEQIGDIDMCPDGPKHPFEHVQFMDRNAVNVWTVARTTGGGPGAATFDTTIAFDHTVHLHVVRIRFDRSATCTTPSSACSPCPASTPMCNEEITLFMDPDLSIAGTPADSTAIVGPLFVMDFAFNTIEIGSEGEWIDLDELRIGTTFDSVAPRSGTTMTMPDAGVDGGATTMSDAGTDASTPDAGVDVDAFVPPGTDGGVVPRDGGRAMATDAAIDAGPVPTSGGACCGIARSGDESKAALFGLALLAVLRRRFIR